MDARKTSLFFFAAVFATVLVATLLRLPLDWPLAGVEQTPALGRPTAATWFSGDFAARVEPWLGKRFAFRGFAIRLAHQLDWEVFGLLPKSGGTPIDIGFGNWLFEHEYIRHHVKRHPMRGELAEDFALRLAGLRARLLEKGVPLVVCMSPSKPAVYPEFLPSVLQPSGKYLANTPARDTMAAALKKAGVPLLDCTTTLISWKAPTPSWENAGGPLLFPRNGSHWNAYAAQRCLGELWALARADAPGLPEMPSVTGYADKPPLPTDKDLCALYNMVAYPYAEATVPYPVLDQLPPPDRRIRVLQVGDSFSFQLADAFGRAGIASDFTLLYYNKAEYHFHWDAGERPVCNDAKSKRLGVVDPDTFDYEKAFANCDVVIVEFNDVFANACAWDFAKKESSK